MRALVTRVLAPKGGVLVDLAWTALRVFTGLAMASHGYPKMFAPEGLTRLTGALEGMGFPAPGLLAVLAALGELGGGILLALGLLTRPAAASVAVTMLVAALVVHGADPFAKKELALLYVFPALLFLAGGGGRYAVDTLVLRAASRTDPTSPPP